MGIFALHTTYTHIGTHAHKHIHTHTPCLTSYYIFEYLLKVSEDKESAMDRHYTHFVGSSLKETLGYYSGLSRISCIILDNLLYLSEPPPLT